jgi:two-component system chemotaxis response regulator CheB
MENTGMTRVLVVDDSALIRRVLTELLGQAPDLEVVGAARDPYDAREQIKELEPDVLTLDVEMPRMDGITFLRNLMRLRPMPVVMVSSLTQEGAQETLDALDLGAVDVIAKPEVDVVHGLEAYAEDLIARVRAAARARVRPLTTERKGPVARTHLRTTDRLMAIGASTGGTTALQEILERLPPDAPGTVITQHMPPGFSGAFAQRVDGLCAVTVAEARDGQRILPGHVYIAPGGEQHLKVVRDGARYLCRLTHGEPVNRHRPSVGVLFDSVAEAAGSNAVAALLTGMGDDGADGLVHLREAGATTIAQDEATSVVWGMPGEAVSRGGAEQVLPLDAIADALLEAATRRGSGSTTATGTTQGE